MGIIHLSELSSDGRILTLPNVKDYKASVDEYKSFKKQMLNIKGVWKGNQHFEFPYNANNVIQKIRNGESIDFSKLQLFPTPIDLASYMWDCLISELDFPYNSVSDLKVLEPGAGTGNLIKYLHKVGFKSIDYCELCYEYDYIVDSETQGIPKQKVGTDFLKLNAKSTYDLVFANPPFRSDTKHLTKMLEVVKEGGYVCTLMNENFYFKNSENDFEGFMEKWGVSDFFCTGTPRCNEKEPDEWIFEDTASGYSLLVCKKSKKPTVEDAIADLYKVHKNKKDNQQMLLFS